MQVIQGNSVPAQILRQISIGNYAIMIVYWKEVAMLIGSSNEIIDHYNPLMAEACELCDADNRSQSEQILDISNQLDVVSSAGSDHMTENERKEFIIKVMRLTYLKGHFLDSYDKGIELLYVDKLNPICIAYYAIVFGRKYLVAGVVANGDAWRDDRPLNVMLAEFYAEHNRN
jgi:hypothetical protein